jgi:NADP-dependent 3-hydroxy acid dehydrogenase YdfG
MENLDQYSPAQLNGKRILITGSSTGIGRATAILLAQTGAKILITGREPGPLKEALEGIRKKAPDAEVYSVVADVSKESGIDGIFKAVDRELGGLDILINNAGLSAEGIKKGNFAEWQYVLESNLLGYLACANAAVGRMKSKGGHIVNIGSMSAESKTPEGTVYVATKSGVRGFTASLRKEVNPDKIKVTLIEPGSVSSDMQEDSIKKQKEKIKALEMLEATDIAVSIMYVLSQPQRCNIVSLQIRPILELI